MVKQKSKSTMSDLSTTSKAPWFPVLVKGRLESSATSKESEWKLKRDTHSRKAEEMGNAISDAVREGDLTSLNAILDEDMDEDYYDEDPDDLEGNVREDNVRDAFLEAARIGEAAIVEAMLRRGVPVNSATESGQTAIWLCSKITHGEDRRHLGRGVVTRTRACQMARKAKVFRLLLQHGADVTITPSWGWNALMEAAHCGNIRIVKTLLKMKVLDINARDQENFTALWLAANHRYPDVIIALLKAGANPHIRDTRPGSRRTPLQEAGGGGAFKSDDPKWLLCVNSLEYYDRWIPLSKARQVHDASALLHHHGTQASTSFATRFTSNTLPRVEISKGTAESEEMRAVVEWVVKSMKAELYVDLADMLMWPLVHDDGVHVDDVEEEERLIASEKVVRS